MTRILKVLVLTLLSQHVVVVAHDEAATTTAAPDEATTAKPNTEDSTEAATTEKATEAATTEKATEAATTEKATEAATTEKTTEAATTEAETTTVRPTTTTLGQNPGVVTSTLTSNTYIGDTVLKLVKDANFHVGDKIVIDAAHPTKTETNTITAFRPEAVDLKSALQITHAPGTVVTVEATCHTFSLYYSCPMHYDLPSVPNSVKCLKSDHMPCENDESRCCTQSVALCKGFKDWFECGEGYVMKAGAKEIKCDSQHDLHCDTVTANMTTDPNRDKCCDLGPSTVLTQEAVPKGAKTMPVGETEKVHVGDRVDIGLGTSIHEVNSIVSEDTSARRLSSGSITFATPLVFSHPPGTQVTVQAPQVSANPCAPVAPAAKLYDKDTVSNQQHGLMSTISFGSMGILVMGFSFAVGLTFGTRSMRMGRGSYLPLTKTNKSRVASRGDSRQMFSIARPEELAEVAAEVQPLVAQI